jgi:hypothetical protein
VSDSSEDHPSPDELERRKTRFHEYTERLDALPAGLPPRCPCCGCKTLSERGGFDICPVCFWEDDGQDDHDADVVRGGPNSDLSLTDARANFRTFGACDEGSVAHVVPPQPDELPDHPREREAALQAPERVLRTVARQAMKWLVHCEVAALISRCASSRLTSAEVWRVLNDYGKTLVETPHDDDFSIDAVRTQATTPTWSVNVPLWTSEEGRSDLTLQLTIALGPRGPVIELDDLRVL